MNWQEWLLIAGCVWLVAVILKDVFGVLVWYYRYWRGEDES